MKYSYLLLALALLAPIAYSFDDHTEHKCTHDLQEREEPELVDVDEGFSEGEMDGRGLASYPHLRTYGYYGLLSSAPSGVRAYFEDNVVPPILDYFKGALRNKYPVSGKLKMSTSTTCGVSTPSVLRNGVEADYFFFMRAELDTGSNWVAESKTCNLASGSKRPITAIVTINRNLMKVTSDVLLHEKNMICVMHEVIHTLGFSSSLYKYFLTSSGKTRSGHITSASLDGSTSKVLNVEPLTSRIRNHFGCSSVKGAYMENSGSSATAGSHFERRQFSFDIMTSGLIYQMQVSEFSLALLEGSGWYEVDYSYADQFAYGKDQGCNFLLKSCSSSGVSSLDGFCSGSSRGCTSTGRGGGSCSSDTRSDGCKFIHPSVNYDCDNNNGDNYARLPSAETYGRGANSKCFMGTLSSSSSSSSKSSYCFRYSCSGSGSNAQLTVSVGSKSATCNKEGQVSVSGYKGYLTCPDPVTFCSTIGKKVCPRNCMGRGTCVDGVCKCNSGLKGADCGLKA